MANVLFEKKVNKLLIGAVLGTAVLGLTGYSFTPRGRKQMKTLWQKIKDLGGFFQTGYHDLKKELIGKKKKEN